MEEYWDLKDDLEIQAFFPEDDSGIVGDEHTRQVTTAARRALQRVAAVYWHHYLDEVDLRGLDIRLDPKEPDLAQRTQGSYILLKRVSLERRGTAGDRQFLLGDSSGVTWAVPMDERFSILAERLRTIQTDLHWPVVDAWDIVGTVTGSVRIPSTSGTPQEIPAILLELKAVRVPGQIAAFFHPNKGWQYPGLRAAEDKMALFRDRTIPQPMGDPKDLLRRLFSSLVEDDFETFKSVWIPNLSETYQKQRYVQLRRTYLESKGDIEFHSYATGFSPEDYPRTGKVRMLVSRRTPGGDVGQNVLVLVQDNNQWRLETGTF